MRIWIGKIDCNDLQDNGRLDPNQHFTEYTHHNLKPVDSAFPPSTSLRLEWRGLTLMPPKGRGATVATSPKRGPRLKYFWVVSINRKHTKIFIIPNSQMLFCIKNTYKL